MTRRLDAAGCVELAVLERGGFVESRHLGAAVVLDRDGEELLRYGDADALVLPRSAMKPFVAESIVRTGVALDDEQLVLVTASHVGTDRHVAVVERMLAGVGLDESDLRCPATFPLDPASARAADRARRVYFNCSGKHAGFLAAARTIGAGTADYLHTEHPVQRAVVATLQEFTGEQVAVSTVDGCGAPVHAVTLRGLARGIGALVAADGRVPAAVRAHPWGIEGPGRGDTVLAERLGIFAKTGAEGAYVATVGGVAVAVSVLDGSTRPLAAVGLALLARCGAVDVDDAAEVADALSEKAFAAEARIGGLRSSVP